MRRHARRVLRRPRRGRSTPPAARPPASGSPRWRPMKTTTASGGPPPRLLERELAPVQKPVLETPVPMLHVAARPSPRPPRPAGAPARRRAAGRASRPSRASSSGVAPPRLPAACGRRTRGSPAAPRLAGAAAEASKPPSSRRSSSADEPAQGVCRRLVEGQPVRHPARRLADGEHHRALETGLHRLAGVADGLPANTTSSSSATPTRPRSRRGTQARAAGSLGHVSLTLSCRGSKLEVDEGWHGLAGHRGADYGDRGRQPGARARPGGSSARRIPDPLERALGQELEPDHASPRPARPGTVHRVAGPGSARRERKSPRPGPRSRERNRIQPSTTALKTIGPAQPTPAAPCTRSAQNAFDHQRRRRAAPPQSTNAPGRPVPQAAEQHGDHQVACRLPACPRGCRPAGCRGSRAGSARA